jgi:acetyltransferase EpsM
MKPDTKPDMKPLVVWGAGGHAKVIIDAVEQQGVYSVAALIDDDERRWGTDFFGYPVAGGEEVLIKRAKEVPGLSVIIAVGSNRARAAVAERVRRMALDLALVCHPSASVARGAALGRGTVVMANVAVNSDTVVGENAILNTGANIDHDNVIGDFAHICPGATLAGEVRVGAFCHVGAGATVINGAGIGEGSIVGAGAVVIEDVPPGVVVAGVPARIIRRL